MSEKKTTTPDTEIAAKAETATPPKERMYTVKFLSQEGPGGRDDITIHVGNAQNMGKSWRIKRDHEVTIPERAMNVIMEAKTTKYVVDEKTKQTSIQEVDRFAYTIIRVE